jgi:hypothetical protein
MIFGCHSNFCGEFLHHVQLHKYQEQPELLDPHLEAIITPLMDSVRLSLHKFSRHESVVDSSALCYRIFQVIYNLAKVRGYKTIGILLNW